MIAVSLYLPEKSNNFAALIFFKILMEMRTAHLLHLKTFLKKHVH